MDYWKFIAYKMPNIKKTKTVKAEAGKKVKSEIKTPGFSTVLYDIKGKEKGKMILPKEIFGNKIINPLIAQALRVYQFNQRQGNASAKTRSEVAGTTKKVYRQKGTGRARHGSAKAPIYVGGGVAGGPRPRDFSLKINANQKKKAILGSLSLVFNDKKVFGIEDDALNVEIKTKNIIGFLKNLDILEKKVIFVLPKKKKNNFILAGRNIQGVSTVDAESLNIFQILNCDRLIFFEGSIELIMNRFFKELKKEDK